MALNIPDPATYVVPDDQALLYSETIEGATTYKYKLSVGSTGAINLSILSALSLKPADLPCLVFTADLLRCLNSNFASIADLAISLASRASIDFVKQLAALKVNKSQYLETLETLATKEEMLLALLSKASAQDTANALDLKANKSDVFTMGQVIDLLESYIGAKTVADLAARDALQPGIHRFIWVSDPAGDPDILDATLPALYMWQVENGVGAYVYLASAGQGFNQGSVDAILEVLGTGFSTQSTVSMQLAAVKTNADNAIALIGTGFTAEETISTTVTGILQALGSYATSLNQNTGSITTILGLVGQGFSAENTIGLQLAAVKTTADNTEALIGTGFTSESTISTQLGAVKTTADLAYNATGIITSIIGDGFSGGNTVAYNVELAKTAANNAITLIGTGFTSGSTISSQLAAVKSSADTAISLIGTGFSAVNTVNVRVTAVETAVASLVPGFKGYYATSEALATAIPTGSNGFHAIVGATGTFWAWISGAWTNTSISSSVTWSSITGKPPVVIQYNGTVNDVGVITLENNVAVADIALGSVVKFTSANSTQGIVVDDLYQKKDQKIIIGYDDNVLIMSGNTVDAAANGTYVYTSGSNTSRKWTQTADSSWTIWRYGTRWQVFHDNNTSYNPWRSSEWATNPWDNDGFGDISGQVLRSTSDAYDRLAQFVKVQKQIQADWTQTDTTAVDFINHKPTLFSGAYSDLSGKPGNATTSVAGLESAADKTKLDSLVPGYLGPFATSAALVAAHATGTSGQFAFVIETKTFWAWVNSAWTDTAVSASGSVSWSSITDKPAVPYIDDNTVSGFPQIPSNYPAVTTSGVAKWLLNESFADSFGSHTLTDHGLVFATDEAYPLGSSKVGVFNASSTWASFSPAGLPSGAAARSICGRFKTSSSAYQLFFGYGAQSTTQEVGIGVADSGILFLEGWGAGTGADSTAVVNDGAWHDFVITIAEDGKTFMFYVDGSFINTVTASVALNTVLTYGNIGCIRDGSYIFDGSLADIRIYSRVLTAAEAMCYHKGELGKIYGAPTLSTDALTGAEQFIFRNSSDSNAYYKTITNSLATTTAPGFMSAEDKANLEALTNLGLGDATVFKDATVDDYGIITLTDGTAVSSLKLGSVIRITSNNATWNVVAGDLFIKTANNWQINPDPTRVVVHGNWKNNPYIFFNPYALYDGSGSTRRWYSHNSTFWVGYNLSGGYNGWQVHWNGITFASAPDDGTHDPWDPSLTWETNETYNTGIYITEYADNVTNHILQFLKMPYKIKPLISSTATGTVYLDFNKASRFKLKGTGSTVTPIMLHFKDGSEVHVAIYAGTAVSWTTLTSNSDATEGANVFSALSWKGGTAPNDISAESSGFILVKFTVVDNVLVGEIIADTTPV